MTWEPSFRTRKISSGALSSRATSYATGHSARQGEHDHVRSAFQITKSSGQLNACVAPVFIGWLMGRPSHVDSSCCAHGMIVQAGCLTWHIGCVFGVHCLAQKRQA